MNTKASNINNIIKICIIFIYNLITYISIPAIVIYLIKRSLKNKDYRYNWLERFGIRLRNNSSKPIIWIHTVSVGETKAAQELINVYQKTMPKYQILVTMMSATGRAIATKDYPNAIIHYLPYDLNFAMTSFYNKFKPQVGLIFETEIWPNMLRIAERKRIPIMLVNARLSNKSFNNYAKLGILSKFIVNYLSKILAQDVQTAEYFRKLGYTKEIDIIGSTKFDLTINENVQQSIELFKEQLKTTKPIICFASSRDNEEKLFLEAISKNYKDKIFLIIPRHPERFSLVENLIKSYGFKYQKRSTMNILEENTQIILGDSMGELLAYYSVSQIAIIGGSFEKLGGQNPLEAIFMSVPVVFGPHMFNFNKISKMLLDQQVAYSATDINHAISICLEIIEQDQSQLLKSKCLDFIKKHTGASKKILDSCKSYLK
jgi:3-deoxy-D-manno-octulosonic-acid transferase